MGGKRETPEQIIGKLREAEVALTALYAQPAILKVTCLYSYYILH